MIAELPSLADEVHWHLSGFIEYVVIVRQFFLVAGSALFLTSLLALLSSPARRLFVRFGNLVIYLFLATALAFFSAFVWEVCRMLYANNPTSVTCSFTIACWGRTLGHTGLSWRAF